MAMDNFLEEVATKRNRGFQSFRFALANVLMVVFGIIALFLFSGLPTMLGAGLGVGEVVVSVVLPLVVFGGCAVLLFFRRDTIRTEYEYTFTNGQLDFAEVYNYKKRKSLGTMNIKNVEAMGLVASGSFNRYINMPGIKKSNWFCNRDAQLFYFYFSKENVKRIIICEFSDEMIELCKRYATPGAYQVN